MKIRTKLFLLTVAPVLALLFFSINHLQDTKDSLLNQNKLLKSSELLNLSSNLIHQLQYQRGLSSSLLNTKNNYFKNLLQKQQVKTELAFNNFFKIFNTLDTDFLSSSNKKMLEDIKLDKLGLKKIEIGILNLEIPMSESFNYFTHLNADLLAIVTHITLYSTDKKTYNEIQTLKQLIAFKEFAGQERALVTILNSEKLSDENMRLFYHLVDAQKIGLNEIIYDIKNTNLSEDFQKLIKKIAANDKYIEKTRLQIKTNPEATINIKKWIESTTQKINNFYIFENLIFENIHLELQEQTKKIKNYIIFQILLTILTISILFMGAYLFANNIKKSLSSLNLGINNFFDFLNFKIEESPLITVHSNDDINNMSKMINKQIKLLNLRLENDKDFINEVTQITMLMKDGDFSEKPYFEPSNPNLLELKSVFNELTTLITDKIKEQTKELEIINSTLEEEVHYQNLELEQQLIDVTTSRDEAIAAEKAKDNFLASMSHEIRTPLNAILGFVTILKKRITEPKDVSYLNIIDTSGSSLLSIINDILDFSKIKSGKFSIVPNEMNPIEEFSNTTMLFASKAYEKHLIYVVYIDPTIAQCIKVDDVRVNQILSNLLSNAIKFTPRDGMVKVRVIIQDNTLVISVQDSGIGIAKENIDKVFSAFEQADSTTTRKYGGTGLGLSISAKLAQLMNGKLSLISTEGKGSTFTLSIPIEIINPKAREFFNLEKIQKYKFAILNNSNHSEIFARVIKKYLSDLHITNVVELTEYTKDGYDILFFVPYDEYNEEIIDAKIPAIAMLRSNLIKLADIPHITSLYAPFAPLNLIQAIDDITIEKIQEINQEDIKTEDLGEEILFSGNVLVAEDNKTNQMLIKLILMDYELDFKIANDGVEAVEMFKEGSYDLVLMDENMPNLNGLGAMEKIKEYEKENNLEKTPIIALTANALKSDIEKFLSAGMDGFVAKPIDTAILESELSRFLKRV